MKINLTRNTQWINEKLISKLQIAFIGNLMWLQGNVAVTVLILEFINFKFLSKTLNLPSPKLRLSRIKCSLTSPLGFLKLICRRIIIRTIIFYRLEPFRTNWMDDSIPSESSWKMCRHKYKIDYFCKKNSKFAWNDVNWVDLMFQ